MAGLNRKRTCASQKSCCSLTFVRGEQQESLAALVLMVLAVPVGHGIGIDHGGNASSSVGSHPVTKALGNMTLAIPRYWLDSLPSPVHFRMTLCKKRRDNNNFFVSFLADCIIFLKQEDLG